MKCSALTCYKEATYVPVINFASRVNPKGQRAQGRLALAVCVDHAVPKVEWFVSDAGWRQIAKTFAEAGMAEPDRSTLTISFDPI